MHIHGKVYLKNMETQSTDTGTAEIRENRYRCILSSQVPVSVALPLDFVKLGTGTGMGTSIARFCQTRYRYPYHYR